MNHKDKYDTIIYLDVLEHIEHDQKEFLNAFSNLNDGGHLIVSVPAYNFLYSKFDKDFGHYKRYNKADFKKFIETCEKIKARRGKKLSKIEIKLLKNIHETND